MHNSSDNILKTATQTLKNAHDSGFSWEHADHALDKVFEEIAELKIAYKSGKRIDIMDELGDSLYALMSFALVMDISPAEALNHADTKFQKRYNKMLDINQQPLDQLSKEEWRTLWQRAKKATS